MAVSIHILLKETYGKHAPSLKICETRFGQLRRNDFRDNESALSRRPQQCNTGDLQVVLNEYKTQTQTRLVEDSSMSLKTSKAVCEQWGISINLVYDFHTIWMRVRSTIADKLLNYCFNATKTVCTASCLGKKNGCPLKAWSRKNLAVRRWSWLLNTKDMSLLQKWSLRIFTRSELFNMKLRSLAKLLARNAMVKNEYLETPVHWKANGNGQKTIDQRRCFTFAANFAAMLVMCSLRSTRQIFISIVRKATVQNKILFRVPGYGPHLWNQNRGSWMYCHKKIFWFWKGIRENDNSHVVRLLLPLSNEHCAASSAIKKGFVLCAVAQIQVVVSRLRILCYYSEVVLESWEKIIMAMLHSSTQKCHTSLVWLTKRLLVIDQREVEMMKSAGPCDLVLLIHIAGAQMCRYL